MLKKEKVELFKICNDLRRNFIAIFEIENNLGKKQLYV
jgi:hypothetical protein